MKLFEYQGKELFSKYGIPIPKGIFVNSPRISFGHFPAFVKSQVLAGDRKRAGGVIRAVNTRDLVLAVNQLLKKQIHGAKPVGVLIEEEVSFVAERYMSVSYDTETRMPVLALGERGGTGIKNASLTPIDLSWGMRPALLREAVFRAGLSPTKELLRVLQGVWALFLDERALLVEINPLFEKKDGTYVAGDAKVVLDDAVVNPEGRPFLDLGGDLAVLASGGGASLLNLDALLRARGKPANYVEYSGNPPREVVEALTVKVLSRPSLKGCWVVGGTANFTDIYETLSGFLEGLRKLKPRPSYPIVIRRDGPRREEAFRKLSAFAKTEHFDFHLFGPELSMADSAKVLVEFAYKKKR